MGAKKKGMARGKSRPSKAQRKAKSRCGKSGWVKFNQQRAERARLRQQRKDEEFTFSQNEARYSRVLMLLRELCELGAAGPVQTLRCLCGSVMSCRPDSIARFAR
jgi:hypothetical protein